MSGDFYSWGLSVGRVAGIVVRIHWILLVFWFFELAQLWKAGEVLGRGTVVLLWALWVGLFFVIILLHELGHCYAARAVGGGASEVLLWPLGGLAFVDAPNLPRSQLIVAAGGPAVNVAIAAIVWPATALLERAAPALAENRYYWIAADALIRWNLYLLVFNLIPLYPLDGGRIFHSLLWGWMERRHGHGMGGYYRAVMGTVWASRVTAVAGIVFALTQERPILLIILFAWAWSGAEAFRRRVVEGHGPDFFMGYDFSRGYTSLEGSRRESSRAGRRPAPGLFRRLLKPRGRGPLTDDERRRLDEVLEKISREGMGSLTRRERRFLEQVSRRQKG